MPGSNFGYVVGRQDPRKLVEESNRKQFEDAQKKKRIDELLNPPVMPGTPTPAPVPTTPAPVPPPVGAPDTSGTDAAMARAKDRAGLAARGALTGLREALGERGVLGSGIEGRATAGVANEAQQQIADVNRESAIQEGVNARERERMLYQGNITQLGQDLTARGQDIDMRGQDLGVAENAARRRSDLLRILLGKLGVDELGF